MLFKALMNMPIDTGHMDRRACRPRGGLGVGLSPSSVPLASFALRSWEATRCSAPLRACSCHPAEIRCLSHPPSVLSAAGGSSSRRATWGSTSSSTASCRTCAESLHCLCLRRCPAAVCDCWSDIHIHHPATAQHPDTGIDKLSFSVCSPLRTLLPAAGDAGEQAHGVQAGGEVEQAHLQHPAALRRGGGGARASSSGDARTSFSQRRWLNAFACDLSAVFRFASHCVNARF